MNWLKSYCDKSEVLANLVKHFKSGKTDVEMASIFGIPLETLQMARKKYKLFRENECEHCGREKDDSVCVCWIAQYFDIQKRMKP